MWCGSFYSLLTICVPVSFPSFELKNKKERERRKKKKKRKKYRQLVGGQPCLYGQLTSHPLLLTRCVLVYSALRRIAVGTGSLERSRLCVAIRHQTHKQRSRGGGGEEREKKRNGGGGSIKFRARRGERETRLMHRALLLSWMISRCVSVHLPRTDTDTRGLNLK